MHYLALSVLSFFLITDTFGQTVRSDSSFLALAQNQTVRFYKSSLTENMLLYNGNEHIPHDRRIKIHPYFATDSLQLGSLSYSGIDHQNVMMQYDIVRDELAIRLSESVFRIRPHSERISSFSFHNYQFIRLVADSSAGVSTGFYQVLHNGPVKFLAKRKKTVQDDLSQRVYQGNYLIKDRYFIFKDGAYHEVKSKRSVFALFPDQSTALRKYLRSTKIKFNQQREEAITAIVQQYEKLTPY